MCRGYKQHVLITGVMLICVFPAASVFGRDKSDNPSARSGGRSDSAPQAVQADSSRGSSRSEGRSRSSAAPAPASSANRSSNASTSQPQRQSQPQAASQPRSVESRSARSQGNTQQSAERPSRSTVSSAPASKSTNNSNSSRAVSSRPVQRTVEVTGTAQMNRSSSASSKSSTSSGTVATSGRSGRVVTSATTTKAEPAATPASVTRKIEPSVSRTANDGGKVQAARGSDQTAKAQPERVTASSVSASSSPTRESQPKTTTSRYAKTINRTGTSSQATATAGSRTRRSTNSDRISPRIHADRPTESKTDSSSTMVASVADGTKSISVPSLNNDTRRDGRGSRDDSHQRSGVSSEGFNVTGANSSLRTSQSIRDSGRSGGHDRQSQPRVVINNTTNNVIVRGDVRTAYVRPMVSRHLSSDISYVHHDSRWQRHDYHHDSRSSFYFSFIWSPYSCGQVVYLPYSYPCSWSHYTVGAYYGMSYYYPGYHRRFIFVSIGGYWPVGYRYQRYYWYGCHPYYWYGPDIVAYPAGGDTYNTYNYYNTAAPAAQPASVPYYELGNPKPTEDAQPADEPEFQTPADLCFEHAVELFEAGNYQDAVAQFREAVTLSPEDVVLPFTYAQALFANGEYALAAGVLRAAVAQIPENELTIYYPRGLYKDEKVLQGQVAQLELATAKEPFSADYQLLLGYQYMGLGDLNKAHGPLTEAAKSQANQPTVARLMELASKLETEPQPNDTVK